MGKSEILMLLAGVALSVMLAMVVVPMFSSGQDMAERQQVQQELLAIKSAIPLIKALEGSGENKINSDNIQKHMKGFVLVDSNDVSKGIKGDKKHLATFVIDDDFKEATPTTTNTITVTVTPGTESDVKLNELSRLDSICDGAAPTATPTKLTCIMNRLN